MNNVTIKQVMDTNGDFSHLELHQNGNVVELSLASTAMDARKPLYKWDNLTEVIAKIRAALVSTTQERKDN